MATDIIIRKQKFRIKTSSEATALQIRKELNESLHYSFISMLERLFQQKIPGDVYVHLAKLNVDVGKISEQDFEKHFLQLLETKLGKEIEEKLQQHSPYFSPGSDKNFTGNEWSRESPDIYRDTFSEKEEIFRALIHFIEKGIYPWWYQKKEAKTPKEIFDELDTGETERLSLRLIDLYTQGNSKAGNIIYRAVANLPLAKKDLLIRTILLLKSDAALTQNTEAILRHIDVFKDLTGSSFTELIVLLTKLVAGHSNERNLIKTFISELIKEKQVSANELRRKLTEHEMKTAQDIYHHLSEIIKEINPSIEPDELKKEIKEALKKQDAKTNETGSPAEGEIYISNAGIVLLHPFLGSLYTECNLLDEQHRFVSETAALRATVLLWYLQTGESGYKEWEAAFLKVLCGLPVDIAVPEDILLTNFEKKECDNLLTTVLEYWTALRTGDINILRGSFLNREGKISWKEDYWLLQVERTGIDILLEKLPWGYGTVKLSWLQYLIHTEW